MESFLSEGYSRFRKQAIGWMPLNDGVVKTLHLLRCTPRVLPAGRNYLSLRRTPVCRNNREFMRLAL